MDTKTEIRVGTSTTGDYFVIYNLPVKEDDGSYVAYLRDIPEIIEKLADLIGAEATLKFY